MDWELDEVERPFVEQLVAMGWRHVEGDLDLPAKSGRANFTEVIQDATLRRQIHALNLLEPLAGSVDQLRRYSNQRRASGEVMDNEGNEPLLQGSTP